MTALQLSETHRITIGLLLSQIGSLLAQARSLGLEGDAASELEARLHAVAQDTMAIPPRPPSDRWQGLLSQAYVLTYELRPRALRAYGDLAPEAAEYLERAADDLIELAQRVQRQASSDASEGGSA